MIISMIDSFQIKSICTRIICSGGAKGGLSPLWTVLSLYVFKTLFRVCPGHETFGWAYTTLTENSGGAATNNMLLYYRFLKCICMYIYVCAYIHIHTCYCVFSFFCLCLNKESVENKF